MKKNFNNVLGGAIASITAEESTIREKIIIREDFKALIPRLSDEELSQLETNILEEGVRDALIIWRFESYFILVDGHNRFFICQKHGLSFPFKEMQFKDEQDVMDWMIKTQLGRRNLSPENLSYLRGLKYNRAKAQGRRTDLTLDQNDLKSSLSTAAILGNEYNVGEATIKRDGEFAEGLEILGSQNPQLKRDVLDGRSKLTKKEIVSLAKSKGKSFHKKSNIIKKPNALEMALIAFRYVQNESRSTNEICSLIGMNQDEIDPQKYFMLWSDLTNKQSQP